MKKSVCVGFLAVPLMLVVIFLILPLLQSIIPTFYDGHPTVSRYTAFFADSLNRTIFFRSIRLSVLATLICIAAGVPAAQYVSRLPGTKRRILNALILFPLLTNAVVRGFAWISILGRHGLLNELLIRIGAIAVPVPLLYTDGAIVIGSVYLFLPVMISSLEPVMESAGIDLEEAASSLGASPSVVFFKIIVPLALPGIITGSVLVFAGTISAYTTPTLLGGNKKMMLATLLYQQSSTLANWSSAAVISCIMIVISFGIMKLFNTAASGLDRRGAVNV